MSITLPVSAIWYKQGAFLDVHNFININKDYIRISFCFFDNSIGKSGFCEKYKPSVVALFIKDISIIFQFFQNRQIRFLIAPFTLANQIVFTVIGY